MNLTREQAERINRELFHCLNYLGRLKARMVQVGFVQDDKLLPLVREAYDGVFSLRVELHYRSCQGGVGRPPERSENARVPWRMSVQRIEWSP
jgi:hypothetical protein